MSGSSAEGLAVILTYRQSLALKNYQVEPLSNSARHSAPKKCNPEELQRFTFVFPTSVPHSPCVYVLTLTGVLRNGVTVTPDIWYIMRTSPVSATQVSVVSF